MLYHCRGIMWKGQKNGKHETKKLVCCYFHLRGQTENDPLHCHVIIYGQKYIKVCEDTHGEPFLKLGIW